MPPILIANADISQVAFASDRCDTVAPMLDDINQFRIQRLQALVDRFGGKAALGRAMGQGSGAFIGQMLRGERAVSEKTVMAAERLPGCHRWFDPYREQSSKQIDLDNNPDYPTVRTVRLRANAGITGYDIDQSHDDGPPIVFRADWFVTNGYKPERMFAIRVCGSSMEPTLWPGDLIVINGASAEPIDGRVFVVIYEGETAVKRLERDEGVWWLASDNPDQRRYKRKRCHDQTTIVGEVVYKQSQRI
jgi:phage repressor protein C with HTH and peptisase S24 domain